VFLFFHVNPQLKFIGTVLHPFFMREKAKNLGKAVLNCAFFSFKTLEDYGDFGVCIPERSAGKI
jgi:hypothetical protein